MTFAVRAACSSRAEPVVMVVGHNGIAVAEAVAGERCLIAVNDDYREGMATSLRIGLEMLPGTVSGALILLADQPLVTASLIDLMLTHIKTDPHAIHAASYAGQRGNPVYFPRALFDELRAVRGDEGGRSVVARHLELLRLIPVSNADVFIDVDTPGEYERLMTHWDRYSSREDG